MYDNVHWIFKSKTTHTRAHTIIIDQKIRGKKSPSTLFRQRSLFLMEYNNASFRPPPPSLREPFFSRGCQKWVFFSKSFDGHTLNFLSLYLSLLSICLSVECFTSCLTRSFSITFCPFVPCCNFYEETRE